MIIDGTRNHPKLYASHDGSNWYGLNAAMKQARQGVAPIALLAEPVTVKFSPAAPMLLTIASGDDDDSSANADRPSWYDPALHGPVQWDLAQAGGDSFSWSPADGTDDVDDGDGVPSGVFLSGDGDEDDDDGQDESVPSGDMQRTLSYIVNLFGYASGTILALNTLSGGPEDEDEHLSRPVFYAMFGVGMDKDEFMAAQAQNDPAGDTTHYGIYFDEMRRHADDLFGVLDENRNGQLEIAELAEWLAAMDGMEQFVEVARPGITTGGAGSNGYEGTSSYASFKADMVDENLDWGDSAFETHTTMAINGCVSYLERAMTNWVFANTHTRADFERLLAPVKKWNLNYLYNRVSGGQGGSGGGSDGGSDGEVREG